MRRLTCSGFNLLWVLLLASFGVYGLLAGLRAATAQAAYAAASVVWPLSGSTTPDTGQISSPFGPRWQASKGRYDYHSGLDIAAPQNTPVYAIADGTVAKVGWPTTDSGLTVIIHHPQLDYYSAYLHLARIDVSEAQTVTQGQQIGTVGNTGTTEFMHLHFEIRQTLTNYPASTRNPMGYLPRPEVTTPTIRILSVNADPIYSPTVSLLVTATRAELDVNQLRVILQDRESGQVLDDQTVDFNTRQHTGDDTLDKDGIQLLPSHFNTATLAYELTANFYQLRGLDAFTLTAQVVDLEGHRATAVAAAADTTPPGKVQDLAAYRRPDGGIDLTWTAPGDSGGVGQAARYELRYAAEPLTSFIWDFSATPLDNPPAPLAPGAQQTWSLPGPFPESVYFALRTFDLEENRSPISNSAAPTAFPSNFRIFLSILSR